MKRNIIDLTHWRLKYEIIFHRMKKNRIILWLGLILTIFFILGMAIVPYGKISYAYTPGNPNFFIGKLTPEERVASAQNGEEKITGNPVYFSLRTPRKFDDAKITLVYKSDSPVIELGVLKDKAVWRYDLKPVENKYLDNLNTWTKLEKNGTELFEKNGKFKSIEDFLNNLPPRSEIALYNYVLPNENFRISNYKAQSNFSLINPEPIRGPYQFYTYIKNETLDFKFNFSDENKNLGADPVEIDVYKGNKIIKLETLADKTANDDGEIKNFDSEIKIPDLTEGVYKIEIKAGNDIVTNKIVSSQTKIAFVNKIWIGEAENVNLVTDSEAIYAQTSEPADLQDIKIDQGLINLNKTYQQFKFSDGNILKLINLKRGEVILSGDGVFSFNQTMFFEPDFKTIDADTNIKNDGINYILADYNSPDEENGWKISQAEFDIKDAYRENQKYSFLISIPENDGFVLKGIRVDLSGKTLFDYLKNKLK